MILMSAGVRQAEDEGSVEWRGGAQDTKRSTAGEHEQVKRWINWEEDFGNRQKEDQFFLIIWQNFLHLTYFSPVLVLSHGNFEFK